VLGIGSQVLRPQDLYLIGLAVAALSSFRTWQAKRVYRGALVDALRAGQPVLFVEDEFSCERWSTQMLLSGPPPSKRYRGLEPSPPWMT
jgi:hypothetical protein